MNDPIIIIHVPLWIGIGVWIMLFLKIIHYALYFRLRLIKASLEDKKELP